MKAINFLAEKAWFLSVLACIGLYHYFVIAPKDNEIKELKEENSRSKGEINTLEVKIKELERKNTAVSSAVGKQNGRLNQTNGKIKKLERKNTSVSLAVGKQNGMLCQLNKRLEEEMLGTSEEIKSQRKKIDGDSEEIGQLKAKLIELAENLEKAKLGFGHIIGEVRGTVTCAMLRIDRIVYLRERGTPKNPRKTNKYVNSRRSSFAGHSNSADTMAQTQNRAL